MFKKFSLEEKTMKKVLAMILAVIIVFSTVPALALFGIAAETDGTTEYLNLAAGKLFKGGDGNTYTQPGDGNMDSYTDIPWKNNAGVAQPEICWVSVDLEQACVIKEIKVANYNQGSYYQWEAYGSTDENNWTLLCEKKDTLPSADNGQKKYAYPVTETTAYRYVKVVGTFHSANMGFHFNEVEVWADVPVTNEPKLNG